MAGERRRDRRRRVAGWFSFRSRGGRRVELDASRAGAGGGHCYRRAVGSVGRREKFNLYPEKKKKNNKSLLDFLSIIFFFFFLNRYSINYTRVFRSLFRFQWRRQGRLGRLNLHNIVIFCPFDYDESTDRNRKCPLDRLG